MVTLEHLRKVCVVAPAARLSQILPHLEASLPEALVNTPLRAAMYLAQLAHESREFQSFEEDLNYSIDTLCKLWPQRFPTPRAAAPYARNPERLANKVYADRMGNGDEASGDGWKYRGRGALQDTGFDSYHRLAIETGIDFIGHPELLTTLEYAFLAAAKVWIWKGVNVAADKGDVRDATKRINGGLIGLEERQRYFDRACQAMGALSLNLA